MFKGVSQCMPTMDVLYFGLFSHFDCSPLPLYFPPPIFQLLSMHILIAFTFTSYVILYYWYSIIFFSFPSFPWVPQSFHCYKHVLNLSLYMIMFVFVCMIIFGSIFHIEDKTCRFCISDPGLPHLAWFSPIASIYLQITYHYSLCLSNTQLCIYTTISFFFLFVGFY
jgi:hypothetical protein